MEFNVPRKVFLVSFDLQRDEISTFCFDHCGHIGIGAMEVELYEGLPSMLFLPCAQLACPYLDRQVDEPAVVHNGTPYHLRKLKSLTIQLSSHASSDIAGEGNSPASPGLVNAISCLEDK